MTRSSPLSPRRRRLRRTLSTLALLGMVGGAALWWSAKRAAPTPYRPDETPEGITSELARDLPPDAPRPRLVEVTEAAGLAGFRNFAGHRTSQLPEDMGPGLAWGDYDNDGDDDLFLVSAGGSLDLPEDELLPSRLFRNQGDGTFAAVAAFPVLRLRGMGAAWGDYDGDGYLDLVVTAYQRLLLLHNEGGTGGFTPDLRLPDRGAYWAGAAWGDFNRDRRLDLYVCAYVEFEAHDADRARLSDQVGTAVPYTLNPASYPGGRNALFLQAPDGSFRDVAGELGVENPAGRSLGAVWHDFDQDGWIDLYVANDVSDNVFYRNLGGTFAEISHAAWVADYRSAMGLAVGDFDRDGDDDLFVTHWVAQENALYENMWADLNGGRQPPGPPPPAAAGAQGANASPGDGGPPRQPLRFVDIADRKGLGQLAIPFVGWGTEFVDLDQDGWLDLPCVNGSTLEAPGPPPKHLQAQESFLFWNRRGESFHNLAPLVPGLAAPSVSRGLAAADYDGDGDQDLAIADLGTGVRLLRNDLATGHWLKVRLHARGPAGSPYGPPEGSTVIAWTGGLPSRRVLGGVSYLSQRSHTLHWGLGPSGRVDRLEVRWYGGSTNVVMNLEADAVYDWWEGESEPRRQVPDPGVAGAPRTSSDSPGSSPNPSAAPTALTDRERVAAFWRLHRAAMNALKVEANPERAIPLFRQALALDPGHEDARYYLALGLVSEGRNDDALEELSQLQRINPRSQRAWKQWGVVRAISTRSPGDLLEAEKAVQRAHDLNPEETGALLVLGELDLLKGDWAEGERHFSAAAQANPRSVNAHFLGGFASWKRGDLEGARRALQQARGALGPDWKPRGATSEGDVERTQHSELSPLASLVESWSGDTDPAVAYRNLDQVAPKFDR